MKSKSCILSTVAFLLWDLALPAQVPGQEKHSPHHHYKFIEVNTFGGPNFYPNFSGPQNSLLNQAGTLVGGADTPIADPFCFNPDCLVEHAFKFKDGVLTDLGTLAGGVNSQAFWINALGLIVGLAQIGEVDPLLGIQELRAVEWDDGKILDLGTFGGNESLSQAVNDRGQVVGIALNSIPDPISPFGFYVGTQMRAFLWDHGIMQDLGTLGGPDAWARYINNRGQVAGVSFTDSAINPATGQPTTHPFLWQEGEMTDLGSFGGTLGEPEGLNNQGEVVGGMNLNGDVTEHAFLWERGALVDLGTLGGSFGIALAVNDSGEVVGAANDQDQATLAFLWKNGVMANLGTLSGDDCSIAKAVNSKGQVVGTSFSCAVGAPSENAALWENGSAISLNSFVRSGSDLHLTGDDIYINDRGEIAGTAVRPNGDVRAFLLIPCDEGHPNIEGCDYSTLDESTVAATRSAVAAPTATAQQKLTAREIQDRIHAMMTRTHRFGLRPQ